MLIFGSRPFGRVYNSDYSYVTTYFFHINFIPLIPIRSTLVTEAGQYDLPSVDGVAVLHGYSKIAFVLILFQLFFMLISIDGVTSGFESLVGSLGIVFLGAVVIAAAATFLGGNYLWNRVHKGPHPSEEDAFYWDDVL